MSGPSDNPYEKLIYDRAFKRWQGIGLMLAIFGLVPILWPIWDQLVDALTIEVVGGLVGLAQIGLVVAVPYPLADFMARRELDQARRDGEVPHWEPPVRTAPEPRPVLRLPLQRDLTVTLDRDKKRFAIYRDGQPETVLADDLYRKLERTRLIMALQGDFTPEQRDFHLYRAHVGFALAAEGREPAASLVKASSAETLAEKIIADALQKQYVDWRRLTHTF